MTPDLPIEEPLAEYWRDGEVHHVDVRPLLERGIEPYATIMSCLGSLEPGGTLVLHAPFEPKPLMKQLERMGLSYRANHEGVADWTITVDKAVSAT